ncbi:MULTISPECIES: hypothetical protein [Edwardsiella]|uniref:Uncharacterized protein n=2 Tax=Edwardsiella anguillarum TaxID=1821960 RepID=A0A076LFF3_9GAMM|nr:MULTISPECIES: hypothetical protein [Edwardsiella]AKM47122.1 hypothetical protein QY76_07055 [Edwardsiella sp. EA181011]GAJ67414.1 hypothetical protein MA13_contig00005-0197 [Edwardsiella piscicida]AIJ07265.1 Hypothetical protein ETEE_0794 [Edwardsiella anguillarum ET080813]AKR78595.1 hypothetical protein AAZ33_14210 [Edwardsiella sp. LADL05-105]KAB0590893.1 hypothetical protein F7P84_10660 [Edwardsiella anguillarum]
MQNLTGKWLCHGDGMTYQITQDGNAVFVSGSGNGCHNVGFGVIDPQDQSVVLNWADLPDSKGFGAKGTCYIDASHPGTLKKKEGSAKYAIGNFEKVA